MHDSEIALASADDAPAAARMQIDFNTEFESPCPSLDELVPRFRRLITGPAGFVLLAGERSNPVGYALVTLRPTIYYDGPVAVLDELYVRPEARDRGVGTAVLKRAISEVRARGAGEMHINVDEIDTDTRRFYERHGFVNIEPGNEYRMLCYLQEL